MFEKWIPTSIPKIVIATMLLIWLAAIDGCDLRFGDQAQTFRYDNRQDEQVTITYLYDGEDKEWGGTIVQPHSVREERVMIERKGVRIRAIARSGAVVLDKRYVWDNILPGETVTVVIE